MDGVFALVVEVQEKNGKYQVKTIWKATYQKFAQRLKKYNRVSANAPSPGDKPTSLSGDPSGRLCVPSDTHSTTSQNKISDSMIKSQDRPKQKVKPDLEDLKQNLLETVEMINSMNKNNREAQRFQSSPHRWTVDDRTTAPTIQNKLLKVWHRETLTTIQRAKLQRAAILLGLELPKIVAKKHYEEKCMVYFNSTTVTPAPPSLRSPLRNSRTAG